MPQIDFFAEPNDEALLIRFFLDLGFALVPDMCYADPALVYIRDFPSYASVRAEVHGFYLWHDQCVVSPMTMFQVTGTGWNAGNYAIYQRQGGPTLRFVCHPPTDREGVHIVPVGLISYYTSYKNSTTGEMEKPPRFLKSRYRAIVERIKQAARPVEFECIEGGTRTYWMMAGAHEAVKAGGELGVQRRAVLKINGIEDFPWAVKAKAP